MLSIESRNIDGVRVRHDFMSSSKFRKDWESENPSMGDNEILLVVNMDQVLYSSLGNKANAYGDTLRTADVYNWFK